MVLQTNLQAAAIPAGLGTVIHCVCYPKVKVSFGASLLEEKVKVLSSACQLSAQRRGTAR